MELLKLLVVDPKTLGHRCIDLRRLSRNSPRTYRAHLTLIPPHQRRDDLGGELLQPLPTPVMAVSPGANPDPAAFEQAPQGDLRKKKIC
ncbi:hypothetical protein ACGFSD_05820 [Streptomyces caniferus]|uniref:hypothetical protein n=1 Tax=Streptomyces caniferus TaxID=285557 RepID=UPI0033CADA49